MLTVLNAIIAMYKNNLRKMLWFVRTKPNLSLFETTELWLLRQTIPKKLSILISKGISGIAIAFGKLVIILFIGSNTIPQKCVESSLQQTNEFGISTISKSLLQSTKS